MRWRMLFSIRVCTAAADSEVPDVARMENHGARPEIVAARANGWGIDQRRSRQLTKGPFVVREPAIDSGEQFAYVVANRANPGNYETYRVPLAPHNMVGPVCTLASAHVCAATANFMILEYQLGDVPWIDELLDEPVRVEDGHIILSDRPGLGSRLNHNAAWKYRAD